MRILLPPSEGKTTGGGQPSLQEAGFGASALGQHRSKLCIAVRRVAVGPRAAAVRAFALPAAVTDAALRANGEVLSSPTTPALSRYAGVVYDGLDFASLSRAQRRHANESILVFSGLFGVVRAGESIPDYRVPAGAMIPGIGGAGSSWRPILTAAMPDLLADGPLSDGPLSDGPLSDGPLSDGPLSDGPLSDGPLSDGPLSDGLVIDLRSSDYASMWRPGPALAEQVLVVRMLSRRPDGALAVVSHFSKYGKGRLTRALIVAKSARRRIRSAEDVAQLWATTEGGDAQVRRQDGRVHLDLITPPPPPLIDRC